MFFAPKLGTGKEYFVLSVPALNVLIYAEPAPENSINSTFDGFPGFIHAEADSFLRKAKKASDKQQGLRQQQASAGGSMPPNRKC